MSLLIRISTQRDRGKSACVSVSEWISRAGSEFTSRGLTELDTLSLHCQAVPRRTHSYNKQPRV